MQQRPLIAIERILVRKDTIDSLVTVLREPWVTTAAMADRIQSVFPDIASQVCISSAHDNFGDEIVGTELPHLLEHVAIELLVAEAQLCAGPEQIYTGRTYWEKGSGPGAQVQRMKVCLTYNDDFIAIAALKEALALVRWSEEGSVDDAIDPRAIVHGLHALRTV